MARWIARWSCSHTMNIFVTVFILSSATFAKKSVSGSKEYEDKLKASANARSDDGNVISIPIVFLPSASSPQASRLGSNFQQLNNPQGQRAVSFGKVTTAFQAIAPTTQLQYPNLGVQNGYGPQRGFQNGQRFLVQNFATTSDAYGANRLPSYPQAMAPPPPQLPEHAVHQQQTISENPNKNMYNRFQKNTQILLPNSIYGAQKNDHRVVQDGGYTTLTPKTNVATQYVPVQQISQSHSHVHGRLSALSPNGFSQISQQVQVTPSQESAQKETLTTSLIRPQFHAVSSNPPRQVLVYTQQPPRHSQVPQYTRQNIQILQSPSTATGTAENLLPSIQTSQASSSASSSGQGSVSLTNQAGFAQGLNSMHNVAPTAIYTKTSLNMPHQNIFENYISSAQSSTSNQGVSQIRTSPDGSDNYQQASQNNYGPSVGQNNIAFQRDAKKYNPLSPVVLGSKDTFFNNHHHNSFPQNNHLSYSVLPQIEHNSFSSSQQDAQLSYASRPKTEQISYPSSSQNTHVNYYSSPQENYSVSQDNYFPSPQNSNSLLSQNADTSSQQANSNSLLQSNHGSPQQGDHNSSPQDKHNSSPQNDRDPLPQNNLASSQNSYDSLSQADYDSSTRNAYNSSPQGSYIPIPRNTHNTSPQNGYTSSTQNVQDGYTLFQGNKQGNALLSPQVGYLSNVQKASDDYVVSQKLQKSTGFSSEPKSQTNLEVTENSAGKQNYLNYFQKESSEYTPTQTAFRNPQAYSPHKGQRNVLSTYQSEKSLSSSGYSGHSSYTPPQKTVYFTTEPISSSASSHQSLPSLHSSSASPPGQATAATIPVSSYGASSIPSGYVTPGSTYSKGISGIYGTYGSGDRKPMNYATISSSTPYFKDGGKPVGTDINGEASNNEATYKVVYIPLEILKNILSKSGNFKK